MNNKIINILGTDGAGKTTQSKKYIIGKNQELKIKYIYCQYFPILLYPVKLFLKHTMMRGTNEFKDYSSYNIKKKSYSAKYRFLALCYSYMWYADYFWQIWLRLLINKYWQYNYILVDRYYLDSVVNLSCLLQFETSTMLMHANFFSRFVPKVSHYIYLNVSEDTAFKRKTDIQSVEYLRERKTRYLALAREYDFINVDADGELNQVYKNFSTELDKLTTNNS